MVEEILKMDGTIYVIQQKSSGMTYVGQTKKADYIDRISGHISTALRGDGYKLHEAIRQSSLEDFFLIEVKHTLVENLDKYEETYIKYYDCLYPKGFNLLPYGQLYSGPGYWLGRKRYPETVAKIAAILSRKYQGQGNPFYGKTHRSESVTKMSRTTKEQWRAMSEIEKQEAIKQIKSQQQKYLANETVEQKKQRYADISKANKGKKPSELAIKRTIETKTGSHHTEETKAKMSAAKKGKLKSKETRSNMTKAQHARRTPEQIERILNIRKMLSEGMSGIDIAKRIGCTPEYVYKVRKGERGKGI